jgi:glycosyltransferase involved in cell wall biosynthesis
MPDADARAALGVSPGRRVALLFGTDHRHHDPGPVVDALAGSPDWQLVAMGTVCTPFLQRCDEVSAAWTNTPIVVPGNVDAHQRDLAYLAADVVVLSFKPDYRLNSGTLMDALSCGKPVIVSDQSLASELVARHRIGEVFVAGDHVSLIAALDRVSRLVDANHQVDPALTDRLTAAREHFSNRSIAEAHVEVLRRLSNPHDELPDWQTGLRP